VTEVVCIRLFCDAVANFQSGQEEISLIATPLKLTVKNYVDDDPGQKNIRSVQLIGMTCKLGV